jgi:hypothetical protein
MVKLSNTGPQPIASMVNNVAVINSSFSKRSTANLLPGVNRTETLTKFFNATVDHLFQPEDVEFMSGYIGSKPSYYDSSKDFYIPEETKDRTDYQLPVTAVSKNQSSNSISNVMFYDDILGHLGLQGANIESPARLFDGEYYSWSPPIDVDKFINFNEYYWLSDGIGIIQLNDVTDLANDAIGKKTYVYEGSYTRFADHSTIVGKLTLSSGMRIRVLNDRTYDLNGLTLIVEGVGRSIRIEEDTIFQNPSWDTSGWDLRGWDGGDPAAIPDYTTIGRLSQDRNRWSVNNRWFHKDVIVASGQSLASQQGYKALRPIIEFEPELRLHNFGTRGLPDVDLIDSVSLDFFGKVAGKPSAVIDGTIVIDGMKILVTADKDISVNNRIYQVGGIEEYGVITLTLVTNGGTDGAPQIGDNTYVIFGQINSGKSYRYDGIRWVNAQSKVKGVPPLFAGFDKDRNSLLDPSIYTGSNFNGNKIFSYAIDDESPIDQVLGMRAKRDQFGDYMFDNHLVTASYSYIQDGISTSYVGYVWYENGGSIGNGWYKSTSNTKQYLINSFDISDPTSLLMIDQRPLTDQEDQLPNLYLYKISDGKSTLLTRGIDYNLDGRIVTLAVPAISGDRIEIWSFNSSPPMTNNGYYNLPNTLISNPNNQQPSMVSFNQTLTHFSSMISNQTGESSDGIGDTKWRDSAQVRGLGTVILQHRSPMLKTMILNSNDLNTGILSNTSPTDPSLAIQWAEREYNRFYNRFVKSLFNLYSAMGYNRANPPQDWISAALKQVNLGKSRVSPWAYSGYEQAEGFSPVTSSPTFVPPTAAKLGIAPVYSPEAYLDDNYAPPKLMIQTHDGARIALEDPTGSMLGTIEQGLTSTRNPELLTDPVAAAWLQFEINLYNGVPTRYKDVDYAPAFDLRTTVPGKWRKTDYLRSECIDVERASFDKWIIQNQVDYQANVGFSVNNQFSFNYRSAVDRDGETVPGHWRGIYRWFYDTDRPHSHPWEMLGFSQKPSWWDSEYGPKPYTRGNTRLWQDLADGIIRQGNRAGTHTVWARPGLLSSIPVDDQGELLPPLLAGTVVSLPSLSDAKESWIFGDCAPVESVWRTCITHGHSKSLISYLLKPCQFIEQGWDPLRSVKSGSGSNEQWLYLDTDRRRSSSEFYVHRENPSEINLQLVIPNESNLTFFGSWGIQHWISEYLVGQNLSVTNYFGNIIRGSIGELAHKFGGFVSAGDSLRILADSFGQIGYTSQMIPSENIGTYLYRSASIGTFFYSGVIVVQQRNGWKVYGYDGINPVFNTIPSVTTGPKSTLMIGNQTVTDYKNGQGLNRVPYGTIFGTRQEVYDFLVSYGRWLESQGWVFDSLNQDSMNVLDWRQSAKDFMYWSQGNWANGNFVALSPLASGTRFKREFGTIQYVNGTVGGTYPVLDKGGQPIEKQNLEILRQDGEMLVRTVNSQTIFGLRLFCTTVEHVMILDNVTQFNDLMYDALYGQAQPRLKIYGYRTNGWNGRLDAPGYFLYQDPVTDQWTMIENFEKTAEDFRRIYEIDQPKSVINIDQRTGATNRITNADHAVTRSDLSNLSKHMIGYQSRDYLKDLLLDETTEFQFYQGFIRQKGTQRSLDSILRNSSIVGSGQQLNYYEEYAIRKGRYGAVDLNANIDFILVQDDFGNSPQRIDVFSSFNSDRTRGGTIEIIPRDPRIVVPPENYEGKMFPLREMAGDQPYFDLPNAGYVRLGEPTHTVLDRQGLDDLSNELILQDKRLETGDMIWQLMTDDLSWNIYKVVSPTAKVISTTSSEANGSPTVINFDGPHGIVNGDIIVGSGFAFNDGLNETFIAQNVAVTTVTVPISTFINEEGGDIKVYKQIRFNSKTDLLNSNMLGGWKQDDLAYVDHGEPTKSCECLDPCSCYEKNPWTVYRYNRGEWIVKRKAVQKVSADLMLQSKLYDKQTLSVLAYPEYFDPAKGVIPGIADREINYKNVVDPAKYNSGNADINADMAWGQRHVGVIWWDLSTTRYIDYEQGDIDYRIRNWGRIVPGTTIDIYEWSRSPIPPSEWGTYVAGSTVLSQFGADYIPSGRIKNPENPSWTETVEYDSNGNRKTWYYFWVADSEQKSTAKWRNLTTKEISTIVTDPNSQGLAWYAAVGERSLIVANVYQYLNSDNTVMQLIYTDQRNDANDHKHWALIRSGDPYSEIDDMYWNKLKDSLTGFDSMGNQVPDLHLNELQKYGNLIRPRQTWFKDRLKALSLWVSKVNDQLASAETPLVLDPDKYAWTTYFEQREPIPPMEGNYEYSVDDMSKLLFLKEQMSDGDRVLVMPTSANNNLWTVWTFDSGSDDFSLIRIQGYNVSNYWVYVDWYQDGFSSQTIPTYILDTVNELDSITLVGTQTAKILDYGSMGWALFGVINGETQLVGLQDGTIQISDNLWNTDLNLSGWDRLSYDSIPFDRNPTIEIGIIFDGVRFGLYDNGSSIELNQLFFSMINYVLSEQDFVDWIFKTSYVLISGSDEPLNTGQLYRPSTVDALLSYVNETKPYRTKIRGFVSGRSTNDQAKVQTWDFDKPPMSDGRILNPSDPSDANILASDSTYSPWYENYLTNPGLIRKLKTRLVFDRVSSMPKSISIINTDSFGSTVRFTLDAKGSFRIGEPVIVSGVVASPSSSIDFNSSNVIVTQTSGNIVVASYGSSIGIGSGIGGSIFHQSWGAASRIMTDYEPTQFMPSKDSPDLISGTDYKGRIYTGAGFNLEPGWGVAPWDFAAGWDAGTEAFDSYIEQFVEGGLPPVYDQFIGNGSRTQFKLSKIPQDLEHTAVWRDGVLAIYGTDYKVPNWSNRVEIAQTGTGYQIDDVLELVDDIASPNNKSIRVKVTEINVSGGITKASVINKGYYDLVQHSPYSTKYVSYSTGTGIGALISPIWDGDTLVFDLPPADSGTPNIWVLYAGTTFEPAPDGEYDLITDGDGFVQPHVDQDHAEELYMARLRDAIRLDTYTQPVGGRPLVMFKNYITDGLTDQFDLGIRPHNQDASLVYLDGLLLRYGAYHDYVINFETGTLVFVRPPAAGRLLSVTTIGEGGSGNSIAAAYAVAPGSNYSVGDEIILDGGVPAYDSYDNRAKVVVDTVTVSGVDLINGGSGFRPGDILVLSNDSETEAISRTTIRIDRVSNVQAITEFTITNHGNYKKIPSTVEWKTNGRGKDADLKPIWGVSTVSISDSGVYTSKPTSSFTQFNVVPFDSLMVGSGAEFDVRYTSILAQDAFTADGETREYQLSIAPAGVGDIMVTVNGSMVDQDDITLINRRLFIPTPDYGAHVVVTIFNTAQFSTAIDTELTAGTDLITGNLIIDYTILRAAYDTVPNYSTTFVSVNGEILQPPVMDTYVSNGFFRSFPLSYQPIDSNLIKVYVDGVLQYQGLHYEIDDQTVILNQNAPLNSIVVLLVVDPDYGYYYKIEGRDISFMDLEETGFDEIGFDCLFGFDFDEVIIKPGDRISVTNFSQDLSYGFALEQFEGDASGLYELAGVPTSESSITVTVNGIAQKMLWDFTLIREDVAGFDTQGYDLSEFDGGFETRYYIRFNQGLNQNDQDVVIVRYMRGRTEKPATAFRQFINQAGSVASIALSNDASCTLLSDVYTNTSEIEVSDHTRLTPPVLTRSGSIWINDEKISFGRVIPVPTVEYPNRALLSEITRGSGGTSYSPLNQYEVVFHDGDSTTSSFQIPETLDGLDITVWVANVLSIIDVDYDIVGDQIIFKADKVPPVGYRNIKITAKMVDSSDINLIHASGSLVRDAGFSVTIPGGYAWELAPDGLQYSDSFMSRFLLEHQGTRS